jgi:hypothetical protein
MRPGWQLGKSLLRICKSVPQIVVWLFRRSRPWAPLSGFGALPGLSSLDPGLDEAPSGAWATHCRTCQRRLPRLTDKPHFDIDNLTVSQYRDIPIQGCGGHGSHTQQLCARAAWRSPASEVGLRLYIVGEYGNVNYEMDISCVLHKQRPADEFPCQSAADRVFRLQNRPEIRCRQGSTKSYTSC